MQDVVPPPPAATHYSSRYVQLIFETGPSESIFQQVEVGKIGEASYTPVSAAVSSSMWGTTANNAIDNNYTTTWNAAPGSRITLDLGSVKEWSSVRIQGYNATNPVGFSVRYDDVGGTAALANAAFTVNPTDNSKPFGNADVRPWCKADVTPGNKSFWKFVWTATTGGAGQIQLREFALKFGGVNLLSPTNCALFVSPGVGSSGSKYNMVDGNPATEFYPNGNSGFFLIECQNDISPVELGYTPTGAMNAIPSDFKLQRTADGGKTWIDVLSVAGATTGWTAGVERTFAIP